MSYLVKYTGDGVEGQVEPGKVVYWKNGQSRLVDPECIAFYQSHATIFEIVNSDIGVTLDPDNVAGTMAAESFPGGGNAAYIHFGGAAEAESTVTVGGVVFTEADTAAAATGVFTNGVSAAESAASFLAAVNGDTRAENPFLAWASAGAAGVWVGSSTASADDMAITTTSAGNIVVPETTTGGSVSATRAIFAATKTVTTHDLLSGAIEIPVPEGVTVLSVQAFTAAGALIAFSDLVTIEEDPQRLVITIDGAASLVNGNVVHLIAVG